jgi:hypothetical protein
VEKIYYYTDLWEGDKTNYSIYRGMPLLSTSYKFYPISFSQFLSPYVDEIIGDHQCEFRRNRSAPLQIFFLCQLLKKRLEHS